MTEAIRFRAEWVEQDEFVNGELRPDLSKHGYSYHETRKAAEATAQRQADAFGIVDWWAVEEQHFDRSQYPPWHTVRRWVEGCEI